MGNLWHLREGSGRFFCWLLNSNGPQISCTAYLVGYYSEASTALARQLSTPMASLCSPVDSRSMPGSATMNRLITPVIASQEEQRMTRGPCSATYTDVLPTRPSPGHSRSLGWSVVAFGIGILVWSLLLSGIAAAQPLQL